jgi:dTMP kinase
MFICLEGIDGAGKSTQAARLFAHYTAKKQLAELVADPGTTRIGKAIRQILLDTDEPISTAAQMLLFSAARAELSQYIQDRIAAGYTVICDRWILSTLVYQVALNEVDETLVYDIFDKTSIRPDVCILLDIDPERADKRKEHELRKDRYERVGLIEKQTMRYEYLNYANQLAATEFGTTIAIVPADDVPDNVAAAILDIVSTKEEAICRRQSMLRQITKK